MMPWLLENGVHPNVGSVERIIRLLAGVALIAASLIGAIGAWGWISVIPLATVFCICFAFLRFGWSTCPAQMVIAKT